MKYFVYNYKDTRLNVFDAPIMSTEAPDLYKEKVERTLSVVRPFDYQFAKNKKLYYFGVFDDVEGKFVLENEPVVLLTADEVLPSFDEVVKTYKTGTFRDEQNDALLYRIEFNAEREKLRAKEIEKEKEDEHSC